MSSLFAGHSLFEAAKLRCQLTGESFQTARTEIADSGLVLTAPEPAQEMLEARVLAALLEKFGRHQPTAVGGPYGITRVSPRLAEIRVNVGRAQLPRWAAALAPIQHADGSMTGLAGLRWIETGKAIVLHLSSPGARIVLAGTFAKDWQRALAEATAGGRLLAGPGDAPIGPAERERAEQEEVRLSGCAAMLAGLLRRIIVVDQLAELPFNSESAVELRLRADSAGVLRLTDFSTGRARLSAPWVRLHVPAELWPSAVGAQRHGFSAGAAVRALLAAAPPLPEVIDRRPSNEFGDAAIEEGGDALALCMLAGLAIQPIAVAAATWALDVADRQLADPQAGYLFDEPGGWVANRRRYAEDWVNETGPVDPPGAIALLRDHTLDLSALGRLGYLPSVDVDAHPLLAARLPQEGTQILLALLDWALAAATRPAAPRYRWHQITPRAATEDFPRLLPHARWVAAHPLPGSQVPLQLRVDYGGSVNTFCYEIHAGPEGVPVWVHHAQPAMRFGTGPSLAAAIIMAEHAALESSLGAEKLRTAERRLLIPRSLPADADPTLPELITEAAPDGQVLDLFDLVASLRTFADQELHLAGGPEPGPTYTSAADGHWSGPDNRPELGSITAIVEQDYVLPATRDGEAANIASVDSTAYRRHLAAHRCALDPFAACYLAAADAAAGPLLFSTRHAAGVAALRDADFAVLQSLDPRPPSSDLERVILELPVEIGQIVDFFQQWYDRRYPSQE